MDFKPVASYFRLAGHIWIVPVFLSPYPPPPPFFFLFLFANLTKDAHWSFPAVYLRQLGNKEQNCAVLSAAKPPTPTQWEHTWEGRAGQAEPWGSLLSLPLFLYSGGSLKIKIPPKVCNTLFVFHPYLLWCKTHTQRIIRVLESDTLRSVVFQKYSLEFPRECRQSTSTTGNQYSCNTNTPSVLHCRKKAVQNL